MAKSIMVQGTTSNAGKSLVAAGLCRVFKQDGYRVVPFKSQNMALNSFITKEGLEMGRAQVMQAEAAGVEPSVMMNPVLLKPTGDTGSQVIVNGEVLGNMTAAEYYEYKPQLKQKVGQVYETLAAGADIVVIEGAGSPAEINLGRDDFVNMGMARMADAPVLLVGDIDRGGVFASLYGTVALLEPEDQRRVKGVVVNKFRGDIEILRPGLKTLEDLCKAPVVGVLPYLQLDLDDEDSLSSRLESAGEGLVDIAVVRLPHISNFTDFNALESQPSVGLRYVDTPEKLGRPDLIILPGTKNTMADLAWLRRCGLAHVIQTLAAQGTPVVGICGGYQMLGRALSDPDHTEHGGEMEGLGLLPLSTRFITQKTRTLVTGRAGALDGFFSCLSGVEFEGYEIHMGKPQYEEEVACFSTLTEAGRESPDGAVRGNVLGSYVHGLFDSGALTAQLVKALAERKGLDGVALSGKDYRAIKEEQYDLLAEALRAAFDMEALYAMMGLER